ncbi:hypothetical protein AB6A40_010404 [Gnathostoma spinigerum]|uniref:Uncharacterized protein n=1 Tax=Gnathostoma spinigerum TaxID=75299 RepID=A0ABD6EW20_9BILA
MKDGMAKCVQSFCKDICESWKVLINFQYKICLEQNMPLPRFDFYQTQSQVILTILKKGLTLDQCKAVYNDGHLRILASDEPIFEGDLLHPVDPDQFRLTCTPSKVEVTMAKVIGELWESLTKKNEEKSTVSAPKNWSAVEKEAEELEEQEKDSVDKMFQKIYSNASDDVKRAMIKSYTESGGTVLSTNWNEIKKKKTEVKPPEGMEYKRYES